MLVDSVDADHADVGTLYWISGPRLSVGVVSSKHPGFGAGC